MKLGELKLDSNVKQLRQSRGWSQIKAGTCYDPGSTSPRGIGFYYENGAKLTYPNLRRASQTYDASYDLVTDHRIHERLIKTKQFLENFDWSQLTHANAELELNNRGVLAHGVQIEQSDDRITFIIPAHERALQLPEFQLVYQKLNLVVYFDFEDVMNYSDQARQIEFDRTKGVHFEDSLDGRLEWTYGIYDADRLEENGGLING